MHWAYQNDGTESIPFTHHVDVYFDGILVQRWESEGIAKEFFSFAQGWGGLNNQIKLVPGVHVVRLVLDPLDEIAETNEDDNVFEATWVVAGDPQPAPDGRLPDLQLTAPRGWSTPLVVTSYADRKEDGPLSVDVGTTIQYAITNAGPVSALQNVPVHLYIDDIFVQPWRWEWLLARDSIQSAPWTGLLDDLLLAPGEHTLKLLIDPGNLIDESDASNNAVIKTLTWGIGPVPPAALLPVVVEPTAPASPNTPNLKPNWAFGTDGPIVVSSAVKTTTDDPALVGAAAFIDISVVNRSTHAATAFAATLFLDGGLVNRFEFSGLPGARAATHSDWPCLPCAKLEAGNHTLRLVIDQDGAVFENITIDNVFEKVVEWVAQAPPSITGGTLTEDALQQLFASLPMKLDDQRPVTGRAGSMEEPVILALADAGYFLLTDRRIAQERLSIEILSRAEYVARIDQLFGDRFAGADLDDYPGLLRRREKLKDEVAAFKTRDLGRVVLVVDGERPFADVLSSVAHELGHARQDFLNPRQTDSLRTEALAGLQEAEAQQFERAFWLAIEESSGLSLLSYPEHEAFATDIDFRFDTWYAERENDEHALGYLLAWLAALGDESLGDLAEELGTSGRLGSRSALALYEHLVALDPQEVNGYVAGLIGELDALLPELREIAKGRLIPDLPAQSEGVKSLRAPSLGLP